MEILRLRFFLKHYSPFDRQIIEEITIHNNEDLELPQIILYPDEFRLGLKIYNSDGCELPHLPKRVITEFVEKLPKEVNTDAYIKDIKNMLESGQILWIPLTENQVMKPGETRTISLVYYDDINIPSKTYSFFNIPLYEESKQIGKKDKNENYDTFYIVEVPHRYVIKYNKKEGYAIQSLYENITNKIISIRLPFESGNYTFAFTYEIVLPKIEMIYWAFNVVLVNLISFLLLLYPNIFSTPNVLNTVLPQIIISISIIIMQLIQEQILYRIKYLFLIPIILNIFILFSLIG